MRLPLKEFAIMFFMVSGAFAAAGCSGWTMSADNQSVFWSDRKSVV